MLLTKPLCYSSREDQEEGTEVGEERETEWGLRNELDSSKFCLAHTDAVYGVAIRYTHTHTHTHTRTHTLTHSLPHSLTHT